MQKLQSFNYNGISITFDNGSGDVSVNATDMIRSFPNKRISDFTNLSQTQDFISLLSLKTGNTVIKSEVGRYGGTWMHRKLALKFAAWLSAEFEMWVYDRIEELAKYGATAMNPEDLLNPDFIINLATELKRERAEKELLSNRLEIQGQIIKEITPKVAYYQEVLQSESLIATNVIAKDLGMSAITLNQVLHNRGIIYKSGGVWVLYDKYQNKGYTKTKTTTFTDKLNETKTVIHTYWTEKGREFINSLFKVKATA